MRRTVLSLRWWGVTWCWERATVPTCAWPRAGPALLQGSRSQQGSKLLWPWAADMERLEKRRSAGTFQRLPPAHGHTSGMPIFGTHRHNRIINRIQVFPWASVGPHIHHGVGAQENAKVCFIFLTGGASCVSTQEVPEIWWKDLFPRLFPVWNFSRAPSSDMRTVNQVYCGQTSGSPGDPMNSGKTQTWLRISRTFTNILWWMWCWMIIIAIIYRDHTMYKHTSCNPKISLGMGLYLCY